MKKRLPIEKLREAKKVADEMLKKKGAITQESYIDFISKDPTAPPLPGLVPYLPHEETLAGCQIILARIAKSWVMENKETPENIDRIDDFFRFVLKRLKEEEDKFQKQHNKIDRYIKMRRKLKYKTLDKIFASSRQLSTTKAITKFFVDSFAVSVVTKQNTDTSTYVDWFLNEWTPSMMKLWKNDKEKQTKRLHAGEDTVEQS
jgi:hypothetical protein